VGAQKDITISWIFLALEVRAIDESLKRVQGNRLSEIPAVVLYLGYAASKGAPPGSFTPVRRSLPSK
jgi:hypothetical protein